MSMGLPAGQQRVRGEGLNMAWRIYVRYNGYNIKVPGTFKTREDAELFYRRNRDAFKQKDGSTGKPVYVEQGRKKK